MNQGTLPHHGGRETSSEDVDALKLINKKKHIQVQRE